MIYLINIRRLASAIVIGCALAAAPAAQAMEVGEYEAPLPIEGDDAYMFKGEKHAFVAAKSIDRDDDPSTLETTLHYYESTSGNFIILYATKQFHWAWGVVFQTLNNPENYMILAPEEGGNFTQKFRFGEEFKTPDYVLNSLKN